MKQRFCVAFLYLMTSAALVFSQGSFAQNFSPIDGTSITDAQVEVSWFSEAPEQWLRAFDADSGVKFFDSGRTFDRFGDQTISLPSDITNLTLTFYEKRNGSWTSQERNYQVVLGNGGGTGGGASDAMCPEDYLSHLRAVEFYEQTLPDGDLGETASATKVVESFFSSTFDSDACTVEWSYAPNGLSDEGTGVRHTFRRALGVDGALGVRVSFGEFVFTRGIRQEIEIEYVGGSDGFSTTPDRPGKFYIPVTYDQWLTCGVVVGCDGFDEDL